MRSVRLGIAVALVGAALAVGAIPATAHRTDLMRPSGAGPIIRGEATMEQMRRWFGPPTSSEVIRVACVRVRKVKWDNDLKAYINRDLGTVDAIFVRNRTITSHRHGELTMHTQRGLRVGDSERRLRRLYPDARPDAHEGHTHYRLDTGRYGSYLLGKVVDDEVVQFEAWPYEFC